MKSLSSLFFNLKGRRIQVGTFIGIPERDDLLFEYDPFWIENGFALSFDAPLSSKTLRTSKQNPTLGFVRDLVPGNPARKVILKKGLHPNDIIDLIFMSSDYVRPGSLEISGAGFMPADAKKSNTLFSDMERLLVENFNFKDIDLLYGSISPLPGEQYKASFLDGNNLNIISKFNTPNPLRNFVVFEAASLQMAQALGMRAAVPRILNFRGNLVLLEKRFDRMPSGQKIHFATAKGLLNLEDESEVSYSNIADILNREGAHPDRDLPELWKRMIFSMAIGNTHDDASNIGFLREADGWSLSPMYSLTPTPASPMRRHHATGVSPDNNSPDIGEAIHLSRYFCLSEKQAKDIALEMVSFVNKNWMNFAKNCGADRIQIDNMKKAFEPLDF